GSSISPQDSSRIARTTRAMTPSHVLAAERESCAARDRPGNMRGQLRPHARRTSSVPRPSLSSGLGLFRIMISAAFCRRDHLDQGPRSERRVDSRLKCIVEVADALRVVVPELLEGELLGDLLTVEPQGVLPHQQPLEHVIDKFLYENVLREQIGIAGEQTLDLGQSFLEQLAGPL